MDQLTTYLPGILLAYSAFLLGIASPGPNILAILGTSMSAGRGSSSSSGRNSMRSTPGRISTRGRWRSRRS